jgi:predicted ATPase
VRFEVGRHVPDERPAVRLRRDGWDDYHFQTLYWATLWLRSGREVELGGVKVLRLGMGDLGGRVNVPGLFTGLDLDLCSLGQAPSYYEALVAADDQEPGVAVAYLTAMRDAAFSPDVHMRFADEPGFAISLLREGAAHQALEVGRSFWAQGAATTEPGRLAFDYAFPGADRPFAFHFGESDELPTRIFAITGYNGVGKTRLLASLGMVAAAYDETRADPAYIAEHGALGGNPPDLSTVVCVSYSAFDDFEVPQISQDESADARLGRAYHYIGLRRSEGERGVGSALKGIDELREELGAAREKAVNKLREGQLAEIFAPLADEPSFATSGGLPDFDASVEDWDAAVRRLSTGHKVVINILVQLCAILERRSLVLLDEPEMHLHPPLVAALLRSIGVALEVNDSFAIVATHSPVVVQEIPGRNVLILRRSEPLSRWEAPEIETYGEHVGVLTSRIFNLDNSASDFRGQLRQLARTMTLDEIESLFALGLSAQARVMVMSELRRRAEGHVDD